MNFSDTSFILVRNIHPEFFHITPSAYFAFSPIHDNLDKGRHLQLNLRRKDSVCYIKHKNKNLWLYERHGKPVFLPLHCNDKGFYYNYPTVYWLQYYGNHSFVLYKQVKYGFHDAKFIKYNINHNNVHSITWKSTPEQATLFLFDKLTWSQWLTQNIVLNQNLQPP